MDSPMGIVPHGLFLQPPSCLAPPFFPEINADRARKSNVTANLLESCVRATESLITV